MDGVSKQQEAGAQILLKEVPDAERFGVAEISGDKDHRHRGKAETSEVELRRYRDLHVRRLGVRKGSHAGAFDRGELEITDVNNAYIREGTMSFSWLKGWWTDAGTFESLLRAGNLVAQSTEGAADGVAKP